MLRALRRCAALSATASRRPVALLPTAARRPRLLSSHADKRSGDEEKLGDATPEEVNETGDLMLKWLKALVVGWLGYKLYTILQGSGMH